MYRRLIQESPQAFPVEQTLQHFDAGMQVFAAGRARAITTDSAGSTAGAASQSAITTPRRKLEALTVGMDTLPPGKFR